MKHCHHDANEGSCVRLVPIFNHLEDDHFAEISEKVITRTFTRGERIYSAGEADNTLYIVHSGSVKIYRLAESGKEQWIRLLSPGDFTGEFAIFSADYRHEAFAETLQDSKICTIHREDMTALLHAHPAIAIKLLEGVSGRLQRAESQVLKVSAESVMQRLITFLVDLVDKREGAQPVVHLHMMKKDIASYLSTTPETLSRKLTILENEGLIRSLPQRRIQIVDLDALLLYEE